MVSKAVKAMIYLILAALGINLALPLRGHGSPPYAYF